MISLFEPRGKTKEDYSLGEYENIAGLLMMQ